MRTPLDVGLCHVLAVIHGVGLGCASVVVPVQLRLVAVADDVLLVTEGREGIEQPVVEELALLLGLDLGGLVHVGNGQEALEILVARQLAKR